MNETIVPQQQADAKRFSASDPRSASYRKRARREAFRHLQTGFDMLRWFATTEEVKAAARAIFVIADEARKRVEVAS
ncbi:MAG: hypothetical protein FJW30_28710 [Acidobacteria bacterium]|nr:hypothetical protein [Acidobacteriota bacterium]